VPRKGFRPGSIAVILGPRSIGGTAMGGQVSFDLSGKRALVTGGRRGIGLAIAQALRDHGAEVTVTGTHESGTTAEGFVCRRLELANPASIESLARDTDDLDILVNSAATLVREGKEYDPQVFARIVDTNLTGTYRMCHAFLPQLKASRGCVVNIVSMRAFIGSPLGPAYGAGKAGVVQLTRTLAVQWGADGIRVNAVAPGWIRTDMNIAVQKDAKVSAGIAERTALKRWGEAHEVAGAVIYLTSPAAGYATGGCIVVDGGYMA
jgi:NAD(P)-dependent dehydrogenase (short-subunit alcohol dehydrogenase family)